jgi:hypothetical protein
MFQRLSGLAFLVTLIGSLVAIPPSPAHAQGGNNPNTNRLDVPISGVVQNAGTIAGTFKISKFAAGGPTGIVAIGQLNGTITDTVGNTRSVVTSVAWPVTGRSADGAAACDTDSTRACDILELVLGPLHLDLLGLVIDLNQVVLTITGTTGAGDLLGNLLCAITGLFDAASIGQQLVNLLNQLVGVLAGL